ncbi:hypothetical protein, partial [Klebsiella pneumoniae]|uniref:hypothetical protein n=1 Tax=Klebsiella pneumoniae TaxID=573 RepID=UPI0025A0C6D4
MESLTFRECKRLKCDKGGRYINTETKESNRLHGPATKNNIASVEGEQDTTIISTGTRMTICLDVDQPDGQYSVSIE